MIFLTKITTYFCIFPIFLMRLDIWRFDISSDSKVTFIRGNYEFFGINRASSTIKNFHPYSISVISMYPALSRHVITNSKWTMRISLAVVWQIIIMYVSSWKLIMTRWLCKLNYFFNFIILIGGIIICTLLQELYG